MDPSIRKYTVLPKSCIDLWVESVGIGKLPDDVCAVMAEDVTYRVREAVDNAMRIMKHCKRSYLTVEDFNNALTESNTEPIYGHGGVVNVSFKSISYKDGRISYIDEKEVNLREIALEPVYPTDPGDTTVKGRWLVLEGQLCGTGKVKDECKSKLVEPLTTYLTNMTSALISSSDNLRKIACTNLLKNKKLQIVLPHLVSFFSTQVKLHTGRETFSLVAGYILVAINALVDNSSLLLAPYVVQLVKIMLYVVIEAQIPVSRWGIKNRAAYVLSHLCSKQRSTLSNLTTQLLKSYQESLNGSSRPLSCLYGAIVGTKILGYDAVFRVLYPIIKDKLQTIETVRSKSTNANESLEALTIRGVLAEAATMLLRMPQLTFINYGDFYDDLYEELGEEISCRCIKFKHEPIMNNGKNDMNAKLPVPLKRTQSVNVELINKAREKLSTEAPMETVKDNKVHVSSNIGEMVFTYTWNRRRINECNLQCFSCNGFDEEVILAKKRRRQSDNKLDVNCVAKHRSYMKRQNLLTELTKISSTLPLL